jgi:uroporphyrinogen decarboxylase
MLDLDLVQFWKDDETSHEDNCFSPKAAQAALGIRMSDECVFAELGEPGNPWDPSSLPGKRRMELNKRYNDKAEKVVGKRLLKETYPAEDERFPEIRQIGEVFGGRYFFNGQAIWLEGSCSTPGELEAMLDDVDKLDLREFILPPNWESEKKRLFEQYGKRPPLWRSVRGPVTLAMSIYGVENLIYLFFDAPELVRRFSKTIKDVILGYVRIMNQEAGYTEKSAPRGFGFNDDNCCLLTPEMYEIFGYPVLKEVFEYCSPDPGDHRYQHSDSAMGHLLPLLGKVNLTGCNFGPTLTVEEIRRHMPRTRIDGQLAPFTFMNNNEEAIIAEVERDCEMAKEKRGLNVATAGSINNGSLLTSMRAVMYAIQKYGRY